MNETILIAIIAAAFTGVQVIINMIDRRDRRAKDARQPTGELWTFVRKLEKDQNDYNHQQEKREIEDGAALSAIQKNMRELKKDIRELRAENGEMLTFAMRSATRGTTAVYKKQRSAAKKYNREESNDGE